MIIARSKWDSHTALLQHLTPQKGKKNKGKGKKHVRNHLHRLNRIAVDPAAHVTDFKLSSGGGRQGAHLHHGSGKVGEESAGGIPVPPSGGGGRAVGHQLGV